MYSDGIVYRDYLVDWLNAKRYSINPQTMMVNESFIRNHINPLLGHLTLAQLNPMVLQKFIHELKNRGLANNSVKRVFSVVHSSLNMAEKMELIPKNYAPLVQQPKARRRQLQVWDVQEVQHFLKLASRNLFTYISFHLALLTGMRQEEILGLRWRDVDFDGQVLFVRQTLSHDGKEFLSGAKTSSGIRSIALDPDTVNVLKRHRKLVEDYKENFRKNIKITIWLYVRDWAGNLPPGC